MEKRLTLSHNSKIAGVCGGIAEYLNVDPTIVRVIFVALAIAGGHGLLLYIALWLIMPKPEEAYTKRKNF
jgi:phage shock protein C